MTYEQIKPGQQVRIVVPTPKFCADGVVKAKERVTIAGKPREQVYVDPARGGRRICDPSVLEAR
jgi:hypothetical protein